MVFYDDINPVALNLGALKIYWYGVMYVIGFLVAWRLAIIKIKRSPGFLTAMDLGDLIFYCALGVILGGRIGYILFYNFQEFLQNPLFLFRIWEGGMAFHGGLLGVLISMYFFAKKKQKPFLEIMDFIAPLTPIGLMLGRIGNFINGELWGKVTNLPWGVIFPYGGPSPRHPSQIYEALLEGLLLFLILWFYSQKPRRRGKISGLFLLGYGVARFFCEFFRVPDIQLGYLAFHWLTMGQILTIPMLIVGVYLFWFYKPSENP